MSERNQRAAREADRQTSSAQDYEAYELLPRRVRRALQQAVIDYSTPDLLSLYELRAAITDPPRAEGYVCDVIADSDQVEIGEFSEVHEARYGWPSPHVAAGVTVLCHAGGPARAVSGRPGKARPAR